MAAVAADMKKIEMQRLESLLSVSLVRSASAKLELPTYIAGMPDPALIRRLKKEDTWDVIIALYKNKLEMFSALHPILQAQPGPSMLWRLMCASRELEVPAHPIIYMRATCCELEDSDANHESQ